MRTLGNRMFYVRAATFVLAGLAAGSAAHWGLKIWGAGAAGLPAPLASVSGTPAVDSQAVARALGAGPVAVSPTAEQPPPASRFTLLGVVADAYSGGVALISVDGKPARPFAVGAPVDGRLLLQSVTGRRAALGTDRNGPAEVALELPALPK
jgi:general secretion pathway protein C